MTRTLLDKSQVVDFTVLMSVYRKETPAFLEKALRSIFEQTLKPTELVIIEDGPLGDKLKAILYKYELQETTIVFKRYALLENVGLGEALRFGVLKSRSQWIARMDSDDVAAPNRFAVIFDFLHNNQGIDLIGSNVEEFTDDEHTPSAFRLMPELHDDIVKFSRRRNPFAHPSIIIRREVVLRAGNYRDFPYCEDYDLWTRVIQSGAQCHNIQENLLYMRTSREFYARRGGMTYLRSILRLKSNLLHTGYISLADFLISAGASSISAIITPPLRAKLYKSVLRKKA